jgi:integrative and conjugative element protein (TIGR02256 family)
MEQSLFSASLSTYNDPIINPALSASLQSLANYLGETQLNLLKWDEESFAISLKVIVALPPLGNYNEVDIRNEEPVLIVIRPKNYPNITAPYVFPDRLSFPKNTLAHLYVAKNGKPPAFCLVRGDLKEWYANKQLKDLVIRTSNWLRDAATGELNEDGEQFDPLRLEGYRGTIIYNYGIAADIVKNKKSFTTDSNFALGYFNNVATEEDYPSFKLEKIITAENFTASVTQYVESLKKFIENDFFKSQKPYIGYILWSADDTTHAVYSTELPKDWNSFKLFCNQFYINTEAFEAFLAEFKFHFLTQIPVAVAIKRPKKVIGFSSNYEFINFYLEVSKVDKNEKTIINNIPVHFQLHNEPLSTDKSKQISGTSLNLNGAAVIGCGALGSKITTHFIRGGERNLLLFDADKISPHNLVRHSLTPEYEGANKAVALARFAKNLYAGSVVGVFGLPISGDTLLDNDSTELLKNLNWIFDFTASESFYNTLVNATGLDSKKIGSAYISDMGNLGVLLMEGENRNPRIDDLKVMLYASYNNEIITDWLQREVAVLQKNLMVHVGVGCNSETLVLADDKISIHAACVSKIISQVSSKPASQSGKIFLSRISESPEFETFSHHITVEPMIIINAISNESWQVRMKPGLLELMKQQMGLAMPAETGGVFIGCVNYKTKTIHVTDIITAPPDSKADACCFFRGISGLPEKVNEINQLSGNQLGYVGEWHTHPFGPNELSTTDYKTVKRFKKEFDSLVSPLPVFLFIITPTHILPYIF